MSHNQWRSLGRGALGLALLVVLTGCPKKPPVDGEDGGTLPPDLCNSKEEALSSPECQLALDNSAKLGFISFANDQDWYRLELPAELTARSLVRVRGGYSAPNTAVNLAISVLREDGRTSLARGVDRHGQAAPRPVDLVFPFSERSQRLLVLVGDEGANPALPVFDVRSPYSLQAELLTDPDANEPNNTTPTAVTLTPGAQYASGVAKGYLATTDDVDRFSFDVTAAGAARRILYLRLTAPSISPPPPYRLSYTLLDPDGRAISEGRADNEFLPVDLATARITQPGKWQVLVQAYHSPNTPGPVPGDLRLEYTLEVRLMNELDPNELNDTPNARPAAPLAAPTGARQTVTGRIDHVSDRDWYAYDLAAFAVPTVLRYKLTVGGGTPRFPPIPGTVDRQVRVFTEVTPPGLSQPERAQLCKTDATVCPKGDEGDPAVLQYVQGYCNQDPPFCLRSERNESLVFPNLGNFEGAIPIPPHNSPLRVYFYVGDDGNNWADDKDYTLEVQWRDDADEATRWSSGTEQPTVLPMAVDEPTNPNFPAPPASATVLSGTLSHGYGRLNRHVPTDGDGIRAALDYDAVPSDIDRYQINLPAVDPATGPLDRTWELQWRVAHAPDGGYVHELGLDVVFCDGDRLDGGVCTPVGARNGQPFTLLYTSEPRASWHNTSGALQPIYDRTVTAAEETVTARAYGCFCFEPRFMKGGKVYVNVTGVDRARYEDVSYQVRMAVTGYPQSYPLPRDGGMQSCPPPVLVDGGYQPGCRFTR